ncbi:4Fe-4S binding protein [Megamonas funiformis]|uniref:4Fe-4S binding protein n=1 Tax=Megamonas funiformis TaxID=437897 RepID=UPI002674AA8B|nr:4Fe-4S binding protein [Megamonas funiformis]
MSIHSICFRIQIEHLIDGKISSMDEAFLSSFIILLIISFFFGPIFCGKLCLAGAITEYLSKLIPDRYQFNWGNVIDITPIRYGMLMGYMILPFFNGLLACNYCNFYLFDLFINYYIFGYYISLTSSLIITTFLWIVVFGIFTNGGRGFCNFLCPVGAIQNLVHVLGQNFKFVNKLNISRFKCIGCKQCVKKCPMNSMKIIDNKAVYNKYNCILCDVCIDVCPVKAISYGKGKEHER